MFTFLCKKILDATSRGIGDNYEKVILATKSHAVRDGTWRM